MNDRIILFSGANICDVIDFLSSQEEPWYVEYMKLSSKERKIKNFKRWGYSIRLRKLLKKHPLSTVEDIN